MLCRSSAFHRHHPLHCRLSLRNGRLFRRRSPLHRCLSLRRVCSRLSLRCSHPLRRSSPLHRNLSLRRSRPLRRRLSLCHGRPLHCRSFFCLYRLFCSGGRRHSHRSVRSSLSSLGCFYRALGQLFRRRW